MQTNSCLPSLAEYCVCVCVWVGSTISYLWKKENYVAEKKGSSQLAFHII